MRERLRAPSSNKPLADTPPAVMAWAEEDPLVTLVTIQDFGLCHCQLGIPPELDIAGRAPAWKAAAESLDIRIYTVFAAYQGESYADVSTVRDTVGFLPPATRPQREARTLEVLQFASDLGAAAFATHIGCLPADPAHPDYLAVLAMVQRICDRAAALNLNFALETGQEPASELLHFLHAAARPNLGINFDPANMILYGTGDPVAAVNLLAPHILSVHAKDGKWPTAPGQLGQETRIGDGDVPWIPFLQALENAHYSGPLAVERECPDPAQRLLDIAAGLELLQTFRQQA